MNNLKRHWLFIVLILIVSLLYFYHKSTFKGPYSTHQWRQADCLSLTYNYYINGLNITQPTINWCNKNEPAKTISEAPILYYPIAVLWKIFGHKEWIYRIIVLFILYYSLWRLYLSLYLFIFKNKFWSIVITLFLFGSPILAYYGNNFLMNVPSFSFALIAWSFFLELIITNKIRNINYIIIFFSLAALLKITSLLSLIAIILYCFFEIIFSLNNNGGTKKIVWLKPLILRSTIVFLIVGLWYFVSYSYNEIHSKNIFLQGILPIWELNIDQIIQVFNEFKLNVIDNFYDRFLILLFILAFFYMLIYKNKFNKLFLIITIFTAIGSIIFFLVFYQVFNVHDYYLVNILILPLLIVISFVEMGFRRHPNLMNSKQFKLIIGLLLILLIIQTSGNTIMKYETNNKLVKYNPLIKKEKLDLWNWYHPYYNNSLKGLEDIDVYLNTIGVKKTDFVISIPDQSINISLYLMNRYGYTDYGYIELSGKERIKRFMEYGAKYLIINDSTALSNEYLKSFVVNKIGEFKNIKIYKL